MKRANKKGFTIVELVIVIAVIAILAAVMIPTFSGIIAKANESAALQEVTSAYKAALVEALADGNAKGAVVNVGGFAFEFTNEDGTEANVKTAAGNEDFGYTIEITDGTVTLTKEEA